MLRPYFIDTFELDFTQYSVLSTLYSHLIPHTSLLTIDIPPAANRSALGQRPALPEHPPAARNQK